jgi:membrane carboxypeptidase/penicillin-binding protein PbpC
VLYNLTAPDPEYGFKKKLELKKHGQTKKEVKLKCKVDNPDARVKWYKDGKPISPSDTNFLIENEEGVQTLTIREAKLEDSGKYTCKIEEFAKEGEGETTCDVTIGGTLYSFLHAKC